MNGKVIRELGTRADPLRDKIVIDGRSVRPERLRYLAYHKPVGVVSTMADPEGRPSVGDLVRGLHQRVFPVGRLDWESSGLLLLTNDGALAQRLSHPRYKVEKVYRVKVRGLVEEPSLQVLRRGVRLEDGMTAPAEIVVERSLERKTRLRFTLREGRSRQVRRMCEAVGHGVDKLSRIAVGPIKLGTLPVGSLRELSGREILALLHAVNHPGQSRRRPEVHRAEERPTGDARRERRPKRAPSSHSPANGPARTAG